MGDVPTEDIIAEPEEPTAGVFSVALSLLQAYGWYLIAAGVGLYFYHRNRISSPATARSNKPKSPAEVQDWQAKEEQRLKAVQRLQEKYAQDAAVKAERQKQLDEEKRKQRLEEMQKLAGKVSVGNKLGSGDDENNKKSLRQEYNPLMGDQGSSNRVCFRRPGGASGG
ncbi:Selenoprotein S [Orchesella cincta]|uniref:Selenoprotein S n=1 Tax=Orchesella cincta TaxID=48709 RepID=A0A1D2MTE4_ORCCI|nr:Selenoprotein S [Orchesella cincta]